MNSDTIGDTPLYNSRIIDSFLQLIKRKYPYIDLKEVLAHAGMKEYEVADESHWFTQAQVDRFYEKVVQVTGNPRLAREAGRFAASPVALGAMRHYILGLIDASSTFAMISSASANLTRSSRYEARTLSSNSAEVVVTPIVQGVEKPFQCENRIGFFEAIVLVFNRKIGDVIRLPDALHLPEVQHPECMFRGGKVCRYVITWEKTLYSYLLKLRNFSILFLALLQLAVALAGRWSIFWEILPISLSLALLAALAAEMSQNNSLRSSVSSTRDSIEELLDQMEVNYNNALMVNEIGQALGNCTNTREVLASAIEVMSKRLPYDRGLILLATPERSRLILQASYGYAAAELHRMDRMPFRVDRPRSKGVLERAFREQRPFLVSGVDEGESDIEPRGLALLARFRARSFICAPILVKGSAVGVLAVDNVKRKKPLVESDVRLMMGIASMIGISIRNSELLSDLKRGKEELEMRVVARTEELVRSQKELSLQNRELQQAYRAIEVESEGRVKALEQLREQERMLILQSRQAALGEMLSNIAHQWRQPLNLLGLIVQEIPVMYSLGTFDQEYLSDTIGKAMNVIAHMSRTIDDFRNLVQPDKEKLPFRLQQIVEVTVSLIAGSFESQGINIRVHMIADPVIFGFPNEYSQVLFNILFNARDALLENETCGVRLVTITVTIEENSAVVIVADNAGGIPDDIIDRIFEPYFTTKGPSKGTGIGLYLSKTIIEQNLKGKLSARNVGRGAEFRIEVAM